MTCTLERLAFSASELGLQLLNPRYPTVMTWSRRIDGPSCGCYWLMIGDDVSLRA